LNKGGKTMWSGFTLMMAIVLEVTGIIAMKWYHFDIPHKRVKN